MHESLGSFCLVGLKPGTQFFRMRQWFCLRSFTEALGEARRLVVLLLLITVVAFPCRQDDDMGGFKKLSTEPGLTQNILTHSGETRKPPRLISRKKRRRSFGPTPPFSLPVRQPIHARQAAR